MHVFPSSSFRGAQPSSKTVTPTAVPAGTLADFLPLYRGQRKGAPEVGNAPESVSQNMMMSLHLPSSFQCARDPREPDALLRSSGTPVGLSLSLVSGLCMAFRPVMVMGFSTRSSGKVLSGFSFLCRQPRYWVTGCHRQHLTVVQGCRLPLQAPWRSEVGLLPLGAVSSVTGCPGPLPRNLNTHLPGPVP